MALNLKLIEVKLLSWKWFSVVVGQHADIVIVHNGQHFKLQNFITLTTLSP